MIDIKLAVLIPTPIPNQILPPGLVRGDTFSVFTFDIPVAEVLGEVIGVEVIGMTELGASIAVVVAFFIEYLVEDAPAEDAPIEDVTVNTAPV